MLYGNEDKNIHILEKIKDMGYETVKNFCIHHNLHDTTVYAYINFSLSPFKHGNGEICKAAQDLSDALLCHWSELWPEYYPEEVLTQYDFDDTHLFIEEVWEKLLTPMLSMLTEREKMVLDVVYKLHGKTGTYKELASKMMLTSWETNTLKFTVMQRVRFLYSNRKKYGFPPPAALLN